MSEIKFLANSIKEITLDEAKDYQPKGVKPELRQAKVRTRRNFPKKDEPAPAKTTPKVERLYIRVTDSSDADILQRIREIIDENPGDLETVLVVGDGKKPIKLAQKIDKDSSAEQELLELLGSESVVIN